MVTPNTSYLAKFFLKKRGLALKIFGPASRGHFVFQKFSGFTLVEILIVIAIIGILALMLLMGLRGGTQIAKARDTKRKGDLVKIQRCLEEYYNDHGYYLPQSSYSCGGSGLAPCMASILCDSFRNRPYQYETDGTATPRWYRLYTQFEYTSDPLINQVGCTGGCPIGGSNYFVSSSNAPAVATPTPTQAAPTSTPTTAPSGTPTPTSMPGCINPTAPTCGQPQIYVGQCASCCPGSNYRMTQIGSQYWCCLDATCQ